MHDETNFNRVCQNYINEFITIFQKIKFDNELSSDSIHCRFVIHFIFFKSSFQIVRVRKNNFIIIKLIEIECNNYMTQTSMNNHII